MIPAGDVTLRRITADDYDVVGGTHCDRLTELLLSRGYRVQRDLSCMLQRDREGEFSGRTRALFARPWWS